MVSKRRSCANPWGAGLQSYSVQLQGTKEWRLWPLVPDASVHGDAGDSGGENAGAGAGHAHAHPGDGTAKDGTAKDGRQTAVHRGVYTPAPLRGLLHPGDILYFPPGWYHETKMLQRGASAPHGSTLATTPLSLSAYWEITEDAQPSADGVSASMGSAEAVSVSTGSLASAGTAADVDPGEGTGTGSGGGGRFFPAAFYRAMNTKDEILSTPEYCHCGAKWGLQSKATAKRWIATASDRF